MENKEYKDVVRDGYTVSAEMQRVWDVELDLARELFEVCRRNNLRLFMDFGTLLGAVRHKGFIPWDDDMDFAMPRDDYDKLMKLAESEFRHPYFLQNAYTDKRYHRRLAAVRNSETAALSADELNSGMNLGIFIDIFPLDGFIENPVLRFLHRTTLMITKSILYRWHVNAGFRFYEAVMRMASLRNRRWGRLTFRYSRRGNLTPASAYDETVMLDFENMRLPAPKGWHDVLVGLFGDDYMTPKMEPSSHGRKHYDTERPYKKVVEELQKSPEQLASLT